MKIVYLVALQNKGTILDRQAKELQKVNGGTIAYVPHLKPNEPCILPEGDLFVCTHYSLADNAVLSGKKIIILFTHESWPINPEVFNQCAWVIAENNDGACLLESKGVKREIIRIIAECGDNINFNPHERTKDGPVLICGRNYDTNRKNPELVDAVIGAMPDRKFIIIGSEWERSIDRYPNVKIHTNIPYDKYIELYEKCSVYLSCAKLEGGGPNSLIEAMHCNMIPVVSNTGNAREYIVHGYNGYIFKHDDSPQKVAELINRAYELNPKENFPFKDVWETVQHFTWKAYGEQWSEYLS